MYRKKLYNSSNLRLNSQGHEITIDTYRDWSSVYKNLYGKYLPSDKTSSIIELGAGCGFFLYFLKEQGFKNVLGIDINAKSVEIAKSNGIENIFNAEIQDFLTETNKMYDMIIAIDVLEHFNKEEVCDLLQKIFKILKTPGTLVLQVPNGDYPFGGVYSHWDFTHQTIFTPKSLDQVLRFAGFNKVSFKKCAGYLYKSIPFHNYFLWQIIQKIVKFYIKFETNEKLDILTPNFITIAQKLRK